MRRFLIAPVSTAAVLSVLAVAVRDTANAQETANVTFRQSSASVEVYDFVEVTVSVTRPTVVNPFTDVAVAGEFRCGDGEPVRVDGFCDSQNGSVFRIRFMPAKPGVHQYSVTYRFTLGQATGEFEMRFRTSTTTPNGEPSLWSSSQNADGGPNGTTLRSSNGELAVLYFARGGQATLNPSRLAVSIQAEWYNPRDGSRCPAEPVASNAYRAPDEEDWVLLLRKR